MNRSITIADTTNINDLAVTTGKIAALAVTAAKIANSTITETQLATSIAGNGLAGGAGTALSVNTDDVTITKSADALTLVASSITNAYISDSAAVGRHKLAGVGAVFSSATINTAITSTTYATIVSGTYTPSVSGAYSFHMRLVNGNTVNSSYFDAILGYGEFAFEFGGVTKSYQRLGGATSMVIAFPISSCSATFSVSLTAGVGYAWAFGGRVQSGATVNIVNAILSGTLI
jgi:carbon monoxide dehydrogenase subunit G